MRKSDTLLKSIIAVVLSSVLLLSTVSTAFASSGLIIDDKQVLQYLYTFNDAVNSIKKDTPSYKYVKTASMNTEDDIVIGSKTAADLSDDARKYLQILVDSFFNPEKGLVNNFIATLTETDSVNTEKKIYKGVDTTNLLPVRGESYVSDLTVDDNFTMYAEEKTDILNPQNNSLKIRFTFPDCDLETVEDSSLHKVFDLPSGAINPVVIGGENFDQTKDPLDDVKFDDFTYHDAYVQADFDNNGNLKRYTQNISYTFSLSFYDMIRVFSVFTDIDLMQIGLAIANPILQGLGKPEITAKEILKDSVIFIRYDIKLELYSFDWEPRYFGDCDNSGVVDSYDARAALRHSVGFEDITNQEDLIYSDIDFNGAINSADARLILRTAVGLEKTFSEVPEGETVKIVVITPPAPPSADDEPENPDFEEELPDFEDEGGSTVGGVVDGFSGGVSEFINSIFDIINGIKGDEVSNEGIAGLIQSIKDIVEAGKNVGKDTEKDNNNNETNKDNGIIVVSEQTENA